MWLQRLYHRSAARYVAATHARCNIITAERQHIAIYEQNGNRCLTELCVSGSATAISCVCSNGPATSGYSSWQSPPSVFSLTMSLLQHAIGWQIHQLQTARASSLRYPVPPTIVRGCVWSEIHVQYGIAVTSEANGWLRKAGLLQVSALRRQQVVI